MLKVKNFDESHTHTAVKHHSNSQITKLTRLEVSLVGDNVNHKSSLTFWFWKGKIFTFSKHHFHQDTHTHTHILKYTHWLILNHHTGYGRNKSKEYSKEHSWSSSDLLIKQIQWHHLNRLTWDEQWLISNEDEQAIGPHTHTYRRFDRGMSVRFELKLKWIKMNPKRDLH